MVEMNLSQSFQENVIILLLTATLTGLIVPWALKVIDDNKKIAQKRHEAEILRQDKIIESQSVLFDDFIQVLWRWRYTSIKTVYYGGRNYSERYIDAKTEYDKNIWDIFQQTRQGISRLGRFVSTEFYQELLDFYDYLVKIDGEITLLIQNETLSENEIRKFSDLNDILYYEATIKIDNLIKQLANELHLAEDIKQVK
jgi:hypothetical protein